MSLQLKNIHKHYGPVRANDGISLTVEAGTLHGLLGENGAGKSTLMKVLSGFHSADSGENGPTGDQTSAENQPGREQQRETDQPTNPQSRSDAPTDSATPSSDPSTSPPSDSMSGTGAGSDGVGEAGDSPLPPDPVNVEYAKKAADMVLDYLEDTRDAPDRELLEELNWTEQDLKRFADRWQDVRELGQAGDPDRHISQLCKLD